MNRKNDNFWESVKNASRGLFYAFLRERNLQIDLGALVFVIFLGFEYGLSRLEWALVALAISAVLCGELFNTAIEKGLDAITTDYNKNIMHSKDISAAAVAVTAFFAVFIAIIIFGDIERLCVLLKQLKQQPLKLIKFVLIIIYEAAVLFRKDKSKNEK